MMKYGLFYIALALCLIGGMLACEDEVEAPEDRLVIDIVRLQEGGTAYDYGVWLLHDDVPTYLGAFDVNNNGVLSRSIYDSEVGVISSADGLMITLEEQSDTALITPSDYRLLAGSFEGNSARLTLDHPDGLGVDFSQAAVGYTIATPTAPDSMGRPYGLWFYDGNDQQHTLNLPALPSPWTYGSTIQTEEGTYYLGSFERGDMADDTAMYAGPASGYPAPGEDFIQGDTLMPIDVTGGFVVLSVEPVPDNNESLPFGIRPFAFEVVDTIPSDVVDVPYEASRQMRGLVQRR